MPVKSVTVRIRPVESATVRHRTVNSVTGRNWPVNSVTGRNQIDWLILSWWGDGSDSIGRVLDSRSKGPRFESSQEHKTNL